MLSAASVGSFLSVGGVGSVLSIASVGSIGSIGSVQSILSIGCKNAFLTVCHAQPGNASSPAAPARHPVRFAEVQHNEDHASVANCSAESVTLYNAGAAAASVAGWEVHAFDAEELGKYVPSAATRVNHTFAGAILGHGVVSACLADNALERKDVVVLATAAGAVVDVAAMAKYYSWRNTSRALNYRKVHAIRIEVPDAKWATMDRCTLAEKRADPQPGHCDYQEELECYVNGAATATECEVKRKGSASWRPMGQKPSLKVKLKGHNGYQAKLTLNNMVQDGTNGAEVTSYATFRAFGVPAPRAHHVDVTLQRLGAAAAPAALYTAVETPDTPEFVAANGLDGCSMWEYESGGIKHEMGFPYDIKADLEEAVSGSVARMWRIVDKDAMFRYYAGEVAVGHWDGMCRVNPNQVPEGRSDWNNVHAVRAHATGRYQFIPWGLDQTNQCSTGLKRGGLFAVPDTKEFMLATPWRTASCTIMARCMASNDCRNDYARFAKTLDRRISKHPCEVRNLYGQVTAATLLSLAGAAVLAWGAARIWPSECHGPRRGRRAWLRYRVVAQSPAPVALWKIVK